jgi:hypothetical protein
MIDDWAVELPAARNVPMIDDVWAGGVELPVVTG